MLTRRQLLVISAAVPLIASRASAHDEEHDDSEAKMIENAKTPADHAALAAHYRQRANKARADQTHHQLMSQAYSGKQGTAAGRVHCRRLAKKNGEMAEEYDALAKLHDEAAKSAQ
jgi:hypothetical protein